MLVFLDKDVKVYYEGPGCIQVDVNGNGTKVYTKKVEFFAWEKLDYVEKIKKGFFIIDQISAGGSKFKPLNYGDKSELFYFRVEEFEAFYHTLSMLFLLILSSLIEMVKE